MTPATGVPTVQELHDEVLLALKQFGEYTFGDKGAAEVMDVSGLAERTRQASAVEAAQPGAFGPGRRLQAPLRIARSRRNRA
jgi:hypothetical protein